MNIKNINLLPGLLITDFVSNAPGVDKRKIEIPSSALYWSPKGAYYYSMLVANTQSYSLARAADAIHDVGFKYIVKEVTRLFGESPYYIWSLGPGVGDDDLKLLNSIRDEKLRQPLMHIAYDINMQFINTCITKCYSSYPSIRYLAVHDNFTNLLKHSCYIYGSFRRSKSLYVMLGSTIGNVNYDDLIYRIRSSMNDGDLLLIGLDCSSDKDVLRNTNSGDVNGYNFLRSVYEYIDMTFISDDIETFVDTESSKGHTSTVKWMTKAGKRFKRKVEIELNRSHKFNLDKFVQYMGNQEFVLSHCINPTPSGITEYQNYIRNLTKVDPHFNNVRYRLLLFVKTDIAVTIYKGVDIVAMRLIDEARILAKPVAIDNNNDEYREYITAIDTLNKISNGEILSTDVMDYVKRTQHINVGELKRFCRELNSYGSAQY